MLPTAHSAVRARIDLWFQRLNIKPRVVGEFEDSALLVTSGAAGVGVFPAAELIHEKLISRLDVKRLGPCEGAEEHFFAFGADKKMRHPLVQRGLLVKRFQKG